LDELAALQPAGAPVLSLQRNLAASTVATRSIRSCERRWRIGSALFRDNTPGRASFDRGAEWMRA